MTVAPSVGTITSADGFSYQLTPDDLDWLSRLLANEGGSDSANCWTMAQRFVLMRHSFSTFRTMLQAFSQPINPKWLATGEFCRPGGQYAGNQTYCSAAQTAHRAQVQSPSAHYPDKLAFAQSWARGEIPNPVPGATDFRANDAQAQHLIDSGQMKLVLAAPAGAAHQNWYFSTSDTDGWDPNHVLVSGAGAVSHGPNLVLLAGALGAIALLGGAYYVWGPR